MTSEAQMYIFWIFSYILIISVLPFYVGLKLEQKRCVEYVRLSCSAYINLSLWWSWRLIIWKFGLLKEGLLLLLHDVVNNFQDELYKKFSIAHIIAKPKAKEAQASSNDTTMRNETRSMIFILDLVTLLFLLEIHTHRWWASTLQTRHTDLSLNCSQGYLCSLRCCRLTTYETLTNHNATKI